MISGRAARGGALPASLLGDRLDARREQLRSTLPIGRVVGAQDVAAPALHLMADGALTGATHDIDGGRQFVAHPTPRRPAVVGAEEPQLIDTTRTFAPLPATAKPPPVPLRTTGWTAAASVLCRDRRRHTGGLPRHRRRCGRRRPVLARRSASGRDPPHHRP
ncbi:hypothetical protein [Streptomyces sp. bgisy027]|uniref:hypothetical protein n=1 Tax=Streptomyces sp. bgisy027 TaxID=3413770 RepID=UPI003D75B389